MFDFFNLKYFKSFDYVQIHIVCINLIYLKSIIQKGTKKETHGSDIVVLFCLVLSLFFDG
jgi:hypothetical protein